MKPRNGSSWASNQPDAQRKKRATAKYKKVADNKWIIDTSRKHGSVRPIDLVSRNPDRLRKFESKEEAVAFEEECHQEAGCVTGTALGLHLDCTWTALALHLHCTCIALAPHLEAL